MGPALADGRDSPPIGQFLQGTCCNIGDRANIFIENGKWDNPVGAEGRHKESCSALADFPSISSADFFVIALGHWKHSLQGTDFCLATIGTGQSIIIENKKWDNPVEEKRCHTFLADFCSVPFVDF